MGNLTGMTSQTAIKKKNYQNFNPYTFFTQSFNLYPNMYFLRTQID